jgi:two-component system, LytTR family, response regulator
MNKSELKVLIIDTEPSFNKQTIELLEKNPSVSQMEYVNDTDSALLRIISFNPDVIFIEFPIQNTLVSPVIKFVKSKYPETVISIISDSKKHAVEAIRNGIFNFLLRPFTEAEVEKVFDKVHQSIEKNNRYKINQIIDQIPETTRIKLQTTKGYLMLNPDEVIYCKADGVYTEFYLTNGRVELSYLFLSKVEELLKPFIFMKVSRSYIINMRYLRRIFRDNNAIILSVGGNEYEVKGSKQSVRILGKIETE